MEQRYSSQEITKRYLDLFESLVAEAIRRIHENSSVSSLFV